MVRRPSTLGAAFVPGPVELLGVEAELDDEVAREILGRELAPLSCHGRIRAFSCWLLMTRGVGAADELSALGPNYFYLLQHCVLRCREYGQL
jgi:hypothetical protein